MFAVRRFARLVLVGWSLCASLSAAPAQPAIPSPDSSQSITSMLPEVRLRKLHLVRPDLIPYPIAYEVCC